jgi:hypothetical protein
LRNSETRIIIIHVVDKNMITDANTESNAQPTRTPSEKKIVATCIYRLKIQKHIHMPFQSHQTPTPPPPTNTTLADVVVVDVDKR